MPRHNIRSKRMKLTEREELFCLSYVTDWNAARAAREAGYAKKQSNVKGFELLQRPAVQAYIHNIREKMKEGYNSTRERIAQELAKLSFYDPAEMLNPDGSLKKLEEMGDARFAIAGFEIEPVPSRYEFDANGDMILVPGKGYHIVKFKSSERRTALEALNKMMGYNAADKLAFTDPKGNSVIPVINLNVVHPKDEEE